MVPSLTEMKRMPAFKLLDLAERFSHQAHGAGLLYNLLLAEATASDPSRFRDDRVAHYRDRLQDWAEEAAATMGVLRVPLCSVSTVRSEDPDQGPYAP